MAPAAVSFSPGGELDASAMHSLWGGGRKNTILRDHIVHEEHRSLPIGHESLSGIDGYIQINRFLDRQKSVVNP